MIKIFIVIVNFNGWKDTIECLKSIKQLSAVSCQLTAVVVDNGSTDESIKQLKKQKDMTLLKNNTNTGFTGGNNLGIKYSLEQGADFVMLLNNDTIVKENLIQHLLDATKQENVGICTPKIYFYPEFEFHKNRYSQKEKGRVVWSAGGIVDWENVLASNRGVDDTDIGQYETPYASDFATGACMFVKAEVFEKVGLLDERYFLYLEDVEFSQRVKKAGYKIMFVPKAIVWHKVSQSSKIGGELNDYFITRNRLFFGMKHAPLRAKIALFRESIRLLNNGRNWQRKGALDFYLGKYGKGSWK